ncbi:MAG: hypothetical protein EXS47_01580 [Candidatus Zambryskibacteria bacterium]|nr:hypothetical protein [Candidatus Zambryskibacteria bacterium]
MQKGSLIEDCISITPDYNLDYGRMRKMGIHIEYHIEAEDHILVTVSNNEPQRIETEDVETSVAWRRYFLCPECNKHSHKLYLLPNGKEFKCRSCHALRYTLTTINKNTPHGRMLYSMTRMDKLSKAREKMGTILYNGKYTKKFETFLRQCERAGYTKATEDANGLMTSLKEFQKMNV